LFNVPVEARVAQYLRRKEGRWRGNAAVAPTAAREANNRKGDGKRETSKVVHLVFHWSAVVQRRDSHRLYATSWYWLSGKKTAANPLRIGRWLRKGAAPVSANRVNGRWTLRCAAVMARATNAPE